MNVNKKSIIAIAALFLVNFSFAQTLEEGIANVDSQKYAKAKEVFNQMITKSPDEAENYFYLGNTYLTQYEPNFAKAAEYFNKGVTLDKRAYLNKIGLATIKLGKGDKSGIADIQAIVKDSREKDPQVLYRAAEALTMFDETSAPDLAIEYLNKAIEKADRKGVPAYYYYTLGDAYRIKKIPGDAMNAYDKASAVAQNKASVFTRMGTLWMAAKQWKLAKEKIDAAIAVDPTYAPAYRALADFDINYQQNEKAKNDLINYAKYADEDPSTQLDIAKLYFTIDDYANSKITLDKIFDKVEDPIKYKLRAYLLFQDGDYATAKQDLDLFMQKAEPNRILDADRGLQGLIEAGLAKTETDPAKKAALIASSKKNVGLAKAKQDATLDWDLELAQINGGAITSSDEGPTSPVIEALKKQVQANPKDTNLLFQLATNYQDIKNWNGAVLTWQKMSSLLPDWAPAYYSQGYAYQQAGNNEMAANSYQKYIDKVKPEEVDANKETLSYAYFAIAYLDKDSEPAKAKEYAARSVMLNPTYEDAVKLNKELNSVPSTNGNIDSKSTNKPVTDSTATK
ncbi:tetratricopeptide repeat protein [Halpernia sp.]|uniref:tetratricopeptide repeat protein n=1 Tax=Halpernia sp. TaxID=2782209 RepID=UPI003A951FE4